MSMWTAASDYDYDVETGNEERWGQPSTPAEQEADALDAILSTMTEDELAEYDAWYAETHPLTDEDFERMERFYCGTDL